MKHGFSFLPAEALMRCGFLEGLAYRKNLFTSLLANFIQTAVSYYVWKTIFSLQPSVGSYTWDLMRRYLFVSFLCNSTFTFGFEMQTAKKIIKGDIILDLLKPVDYRRMTFFRLLGNAGIEFGLTFLFTGCFYLYVNGMDLRTLARIPLFLLSLFLGIRIKFGIQYLFSLLCFYTDNAYGVTKAREVLTNFFSGALIPLAVFPNLLRNLCSYLPFQGIVYVPCSIFLGTLSVRETLWQLLIQLFWILLLYLFGRLAWKKASRVLSFYGG